MKSKNIANMAQVEEHLAEFHLQYYKKRKENKGALGFLLAEQGRVCAVLSFWYSQIKT
jgi:hypothetical protein